MDDKNTLLAEAPERLPDGDVAAPTAGTCSAAELVAGAPARAAQPDSLSGCPGATERPARAEDEAVPEPPAGVRNLRRVRARTVQVQLRIDEEFSHVLPQASAAHLAALRASLREHKGTRDCLLVWAPHDILVEGMTRFRLCCEEDLSVWLGDVEFAGREAALEFIRKNQLGRRNLGQLAASCVRGEIYNSRKKNWGGKHNKDKATGQRVRLVDTAREVGDEFKVDARTIRRDGKLADAVAAIEKKCGTEQHKAREALLCPDHRLNRHAIEQLARKEPAELLRDIDYLIDHGKLPRKAKEKAQGRKVLLPCNREELARALLDLWKIPEAEQFQKVFAKALKKARRQARDEAA
jgi:hypothetical protein